MATHSSILAWRIPWTEEPGGLQSMRLQRVGYNWVAKHTHTYLHEISLTGKFIKTENSVLSAARGDKGGVIA